MEKIPQKGIERFRLLFEHLAWIEHQFLSGIRDSTNIGSLWGIMRGVGGVRKSIHQSWLPKGLGLGLLCWGFKGVQGEIPLEEASTIQTESVAFPRGQCTSPRGLPVVIGTVQHMHCVRRRLLGRGLGFHVCTIYKSVHYEKSLETYLMILVYIYIYIYIYIFEIVHIYLLIAVSIHLKQYI